MADRFPAYTAEQLGSFARAVVRAAGLAVGTESGSDVGVTLDAAARLLMGAQVAAKHAYDQLLPVTSTAQTLSEELERLAIDYSKGPTKARGRMIVSGLSPIRAGTKFDLPADIFHDGVARTVVVTSGYEPRATVDGSNVSTTVTVGLGSTRSRVRLMSAVHASYVRVGDVLFNGSTLSPDTAVAVVTAINSDQSLSVSPPFPASIPNGADLTVYGYVGVVDIEADEAGPGGNSQTGYFFDEESGHGLMVLSLTGGSDGEERQPADIARAAAWVQDHRAWPPGAGNAQHWREIVLRCPTVYVDDAVVFMGTRGPSTIDIVAIGPSARLSAPGFLSARTDFVSGGGNSRVLGAAAIAELQSWADSNAAYHDDVRVLPVTHEYRGQGTTSASDRTHLADISAVDITVTPAFGYGNDVGQNWQSIGHTAYADTERLYATGTMPPFQVGHRVWYRLIAGDSDGQLALTVVAPIVAVSRNRDYVTVGDFAKLARIVDPTRFLPKLEVLDWGTAGPLTQPVLDAIYDYYDALGPGSFVTPEYGASYQVARGHAGVRTFPSARHRRWPTEGYRWSSGVRTGMLLARIRSIPGVISAQMAGTSMAPVAIDYDPCPLKTAALGTARVRIL